jgi:cytochrome P450
MSSVPVREAIPATLLLDPAVIDRPSAFYRRLHEEAPVWQVPGTDVVVVSSFEGVTEAVRRVDAFSSNMRALIYRGDAGTPELIPFGGPDEDALATADPPFHTAHRSSVFPEFVARRMAALRPEIERMADHHLEQAFGCRMVEFMNDVANAVPIRVVSRLIGFHAEDPDRLLAAAFDSTQMLAATRPLQEVLSAMERTAGVVWWIDSQLDSARSKGGEGILGAIGAALADGELHQREAVVILHTLLSAGGESTTSVLGNAVHALAEHVDLQDGLRDDPTLLTSFIEEMLRMESPFRYHMRHATRTCELLGVTVKEGSTVLLLWAAANRDPAVFDRADEVVLNRARPKHHLAFGRGIHHCVGAPLARLEAEVILGRLLERTNHFALHPDHPAIRGNSLMVRRFASLPLIVHEAA